MTTLTPPSWDAFLGLCGRDAVGTAGLAPSARDLQGLAADLARVATHSRAIIRAAVGEKLVEPEHGELIDNALAESAAGWLEIAERWTGFHTAAPPTPSKIAASHALGQALIAVTRDGREWAEPADIAARVNLAATLAALRRAADVARDVAERQEGLPESLAACGHMFASAAMLAPSVKRLHSRLRGGLVPAGEGEIAKLASSVRRRSDSTHAAARLQNRLFSSKAW